MCVLLAVVVLAPSTSDTVVLLAAIALQLITAPIAGDRVGQVAHLSGTRRYATTTGGRTRHPDARDG